MTVLRHTEPVDTHSGIHRGIKFGRSFQCLDRNRCQLRATFGRHLRDHFLVWLKILCTGFHPFRRRLQAIAKNYVRHALEQGNIGAWTQLQVDVCHLRKLRADWVSDDQFHATFTGSHNARAGNRMAMYWVATGGQQQVGDINIP